jgi:hypothetical protein
MPGNESRIQRQPTSGNDRPPPPLSKLVLTADDVRDLYEAARSLAAMGGAPYLNRLFDAQSALAAGQLDRVGQILTRAREEFEKSHHRLLRFRPEAPGERSPPREQQRLAAKKKQVEDVLALFDAYLAVVARMSKAAPRTREEVQSPEAPESSPQAADAITREFVSAFEAGKSADACFEVVCRYFECAAAIAPEDVAPGTLYFLRTKTTGHVLRVIAAPAGNLVPLQDALTRDDVRPQSIDALLEQGRKGKFFALLRREKVAASEGKGGQGTQDRGEDSPPATSDPLEAQNPLLDRQLFNILMLAVKQSGINVSTDLIVQVRDNEFRKGEYHDAFEKLNQLATRYEAAAARRKEELRQHDVWLSGGQSGLSLREVEEAKLKNANERTRLEHATHRFGLVVEPLRILSRGQH